MKLVRRSVHEAQGKNNALDLEIHISKCSPGKVAFPTYGPVERTVVE